MTEEEYFRKNYPDSCYGDRPLSPHWDFFQSGVEFGERQSEKRIANLEQKLKIERSSRIALVNKIADLEKEITELKGEADSVLDNWCKGDDPCPHLKKRDEQLTKAKELLKEFVHHYKAKTIYIENMQDLLEQSDQFLSEVEK